MEWWVNVLFGFAIGYFLGNKDFRQKVSAWLNKDKSNKKKTK